ncbi:hypothetical protein Ahy_A02g008165 [Arachis hypogaea]|uniref:Uncharacterized protein n=1 Tax=Arachis hypogaea TaxID=3818 RepID=A0A445EDU7_ARAHY|nr:hypothetical protein Ahy_A02g008165 [Arachis hypogaea]
MISENSFLVLVHYKCTVKKKMRARIKFTDKDPLSVLIRLFTSLNIVLQTLGLHGMKRVEKLYYIISISVVRDGVTYDLIVIDSDEDLQVLFYCRHQFSKVRIYKLLAKFVDVVSSSGGSNQNHQSILMTAASIASAGDLVVSSSFATDLHRDEIAEIDANRNTPVMILISGEVIEPNMVKDVLADNDDVDPAMIEGVFLLGWWSIELTNSTVPAALFNSRPRCHETAGFSDVESGFGLEIHKTTQV